MYQGRQLEENNLPLLLLYNPLYLKPSVPDQQRGVHFRYFQRKQHPFLPDRTFETLHGSSLDLLHLISRRPFSDNLGFTKGTVLILSQCENSFDVVNYLPGVSPAILWGVCSKGFSLSPVTIVLYRKRSRGPIILQQTFSINLLFLFEIYRQTLASAAVCYLWNIYHTEFLSRISPTHGGSYSIPCIKWFLAPSTCTISFPSNW